MDLSSFAVFQTVRQRLDWTSERQSVLAQNIANADTPGYRARDVEDFASVMARTRGPGDLAPMRTHPAHLSGSGAVMDARIQAMMDTPEAAPNGNTVSLEQQMMEMTDTAAEHRLALDLFRRHTSMLRIALGRGGGG
jgi:flagellar basal-body rod protein FlgB